MNLLDSLASAMNDLQRAGASFALVGGLAVSIRTEPRFTRDADLAVAVASDKEAEALVFGLVGGGYRTLASLQQDRTGRLATVRLVPPHEDEPGMVVDLLFASCGIEPEIVAAATFENISRHVSGPVAVPGHLIAMKVLSESDLRFQDRADLVALIRASSLSDLEVAHSAVGLITSRGFARNKDLPEVLDRFIRLATTGQDSSP